MMMVMMMVVAVEMAKCSKYYNRCLVRARENYGWVNLGLREVNAKTGLGI